MICKFMTSSLPWLALVIFLYLGNTAVLGETLLPDRIPADTTWTLSGSPYIAKQTVFIPNDVTVRVEPGVQVRLDPRVYIVVKGTLISRGTATQKVVFTKNQGISLANAVPEGIRLVRGREIRDGELQLFHQGRWRGICNRNFVWSQSDSRHACRLLGFADGNFTSQRIAENYTHNMMYENPGCSGQEKRLTDCPGAINLTLGRDVCHFQELVGLICWQVNNDRFADNWAGMQFWNSTLRLTTLHTVDTKMNISASELVHTNIEYAGVNGTDHNVAAISASPFAPLLDNVLLTHNAYDAINFTDNRGAILLLNSQFVSNRGHGFNISAVAGHVYIERSTSQANGGHGGVVYFLPFHWQDIHTEILHHGLDICDPRSVVPSSPRFPFLTLAQIRVPNSIGEGVCYQQIQTGIPGQVITISMLEVERDPEAFGFLRFYDVQMNRRELAVWPIGNEQTPNAPAVLYQGVVSAASQVSIEFAWKKPYTKTFCAKLRQCIRVVLQISTGFYKVPEVRVMDSLFVNNTQRGLSVENPHTYVMVNRSRFISNEYDAGMLIVNGSADVLSNHSLFENNDRCGLNISTSSGFRVVNSSMFISNRGFGLDVWNQEFQFRTRWGTPNYPRTTHVAYSQFKFNLRAGMRFYNACSEHNILINFTSVQDNVEQGLLMHSCLFPSMVSGNTNLTVAFSSFSSNLRAAIHVEPMGAMIGQIVNNTFRDHTRGVILIDNSNEFEKIRLYRDLFVDYGVYYNDFTANQGAFVVNVRLTKGSQRQKLVFSFNRLFGNMVLKAPGSLNPRSSAHAVAIVSSSTIDFIRNLMQNPNSDFELATHLDDAESIINCVDNFWGTQSDWGGIGWGAIIEKVFGRVFGKTDRYTLASIEFWPLLKDTYLRTNIKTDNEPKYRHYFRRFNELTIGGPIDPSVQLNYVLEPNVYRVTRDIFVPFQSRLTIQAGSKLLFDNSIGIFVQGELFVDGTVATPISMSVGDDPFDVPNASLSVNSSIVRLVDGATPLEGRLELLMNGAWGTVCDRGFTSREARVVCASLGLVAHPNTWELGREKRRPGQANQPIHLAGLYCQTWDIDLRQCDADGIRDHNCDHSQDVHIRCHRRGWTGMRFTSSITSSYVRYANLGRTGLLDYYLLQFSPGVTVDFNLHKFTGLRVTNGLSDGMAIRHNDIFANSQINEANLSNNLGNGLLTRSTYLAISNSIFNDNAEAGLRYDPSFTEEEAFQLRAAMPKSLQLMDFIYPKPALSAQTDGLIFVVTGGDIVQENRTYRFEIVTPDIRQRLVLQILDYNPNDEEENVTIFNSAASEINDFTPQWQIPGDLPFFPVVSIGQKLTLQIVVRGQRSNRLTLTVRSKTFNEIIGGNIVSYYPLAQVKISKSVSLRNRYGIVVKHYNDPTDRYKGFNVRKRAESIQLDSVRVEGNRQDAFYVPSVSKFYNDFFAPSYAETIEGSSRTSRINYTITNCDFIRNGRGFRLEHNHVEFSNNVWFYYVQNSRFTENLAGGLEMDLPFVSKRFDWRYEEGADHALFFSDNYFTKNQQFQFRISGYYALTNIIKNTFKENSCKQGIVMFDGMEKRLQFLSNTIVDNFNCFYVLQMDMYSQTELAFLIPAVIMDNTMLRNKCPPSTLLASALKSTPECYTVGVFGVQNVTVNRNLLRGGNVGGFEMVTGLSTSSIYDVMDVTGNWWGTTDVEAIRELIFDFDDWNNFALAKFERFLLAESFDAPLFKQSIPQPSVDITSVSGFGGRLYGNVRLNRRGKSYLVVRDLTIMPGAELSIDAGVVVEFAPNIGLLVLGRLVAEGAPNSPIELRPASSDSFPRVKRAAASSDLSDVSVSDYGGGLAPDTRSDQARFVGGEKGFNEGFVEFFNQTANRWDLVCDNQFSEEVGRVICRQMGLPSDNSLVRFTYLYDYQMYGFDNPRIVKYFWMVSYKCFGTEARLDDCVRRLNYDAFRCGQRRGYVFVRCAASNLQVGDNYWGNVRLVSQFVEQNSAPTLLQSIFTHVKIYGAGMLHRERVAAIQTTFHNPSFHFITLYGSASHGLQLIAPRGFVKLTNSTIRDNLGRGYSLLVLNGDSADPARQESLSFTPLVESTLSYDIFGLMSMCQPAKEIFVLDRILLYYKYSYQTRACTKMFRSKIRGKSVAIRFLQLNLYYDPFTKNSIEMFNGDNFNATELIGQLTGATSSEPTRTQFVTSEGYDILGVHVHASSASGVHGFIAEVVTLPISPDKTYPDLNRYMEHVVHQNSFARNQLGAVQVLGVGEINPDVTLYNNVFRENGLALLNITSAACIDVEVQNAKNLAITNNLLYDNRGGMKVDLRSSGVAKAARANVSNNVFARITHSSALSMTGNYFNTLNVQNNFFINNYAEMRQLVHVAGVLMKPFSGNYLFKNRANSLLHITGLDNLSTYSEFSWNGFYMNEALNWTRKSTMFAASTKHMFRHNFFYNPKNDFELSTGNQSVLRVEPLRPGNQCPQFTRECTTGWTVRLEQNACVCYRKDAIDMRLNWWGDKSTYFIMGKIWDNYDDGYILPVDYTDAYADNNTVLGGSMFCPPTWNSTNDGNCFWFLGGPMPFLDARSFCRDEIGGALGDSNERVNWFSDIMKKRQSNFEWINQFAWNTRSWVHSERDLGSECPVVRNGWMEGFNCEVPISSICQISPDGSVTGLRTDVIAAISSVVSVAILFILLLAIAFYIKTRRRNKEHFVRRQSLRASMRSAKTLDTLADKTPEQLAAAAAEAERTGDLNQWNSLGPQYGGPSSVTSSGTTRTKVALVPGIRMTDTASTLDKARVEELQSRSSTDNRNRNVRKPKDGKRSLSSLSESSHSTEDLIEKPNYLRGRAENEIAGVRAPIHEMTAAAPVFIRDPSRDPSHSGHTAQRNRPTMQRPNRQQASAYDDQLSEVDSMEKKAPSTASSVSEGPPAYMETSVDKRLLDSNNDTIAKYIPDSDSDVDFGSEFASSYASSQKTESRTPYQNMSVLAPSFTAPLQKQKQKPSSTFPSQKNPSVLRPPPNMRRPQPPPESLENPRQLRTNIPSGNTSAQSSNTKLDMRYTPHETDI